MKRSLNYIYNTLIRKCSDYWLKRNFDIYRIKNKHIKALKKLKYKDELKVVFLLIHESVWKYEGLYRLMEKDERFNPLVIVCPYISHGEKTMLREMNQAYTAFKENEYNTIKSLKENGNWLNIKDEIKPDIVFFTNPWLLTRKEYYITNFKDILTCYVPYFFHVTKHLKENYGSLMHNMVWKLFIETNKHKEFAIQYSYNNAFNAVVTGYPGLDPILHHGPIQSDPWKSLDKSTKRIIWAPHHTVEGQGAGLLFSNFKRYANLFLELAQNQPSKIQIAFKPHPLLKPKLYLDEDWGEDKTNLYYDSWNNLDNGLLAEGDYINLFLTSDALIHDSGSFLVEYLATKKPCLYTLTDPNVPERLNEFGEKAFKLHYHAYKKSDIVEFINNVVFGENDKMYEKRKEFVLNYLQPPNQRSASQNIIDNILIFN